MQNSLTSRETLKMMTKWLNRFGMDLTFKKQDKGWLLYKIVKTGTTFDKSKNPYFVAGLQNAINMIEMAFLIKGYFWHEMYGFFPMEPDQLDALTFEEDRAPLNPMIKEKIRSMILAEIEALPKPSPPPEPRDLAKE